MAVYNVDGYGIDVPTKGRSATTATNWIAAAISILLVIGVLVWGYKILVRDVNGIPVVRAIEGPMRVQPEDPGGVLSNHQGLSVNQVAAEGGASAPAERLVLAPNPTTLEDEDVTVNELPQQVDAAVLAALETETTTALISDEPNTPIATETTDMGAAKSLRPHLRPNGLRTAAAQPAAPAQTPAPAPAQTNATVTAPAEVSTNVPAGTQLVQMGAFPSAEIARGEWARLNKKFSELLADKTLVIQQAQTGGRTFYRLRASGFADSSAARRFCAALIAEKTDCLSVVSQ